MHEQQIVRNTLANLFVHTVKGEAEAAEVLVAFAAWGAGDPPSPVLAKVRGEYGPPLFTPQGLHPAYQRLESYARRRARLYPEVWEQVQEEKVVGKSLFAARLAWNGCLFFEVHELLEPLWLVQPDGKRSSWLQGLIVAAEGMYQVENGNLLGAMSLLRGAVADFENAPQYTGLDLDAFTKVVEILAEGVTRGRINSLKDVGDFSEYLINLK